MTEIKSYDVLVDRRIVKPPGLARVQQEVLESAVGSGPIPESECL
jgi:hypothetical protein